MTELTLHAYDHEPEQGGRFELESEDRIERGWVTLVRWLDCPGGCSAGAVWQGDVVDCHVCEGGGRVPVGVGGAYLYGCCRFRLPEDPDVEMFRLELRHFIPAPGPESAVLPPLDDGLIECEGCPTLLDEESCKRDIEGVPLCDSCYERALVEVES